MVHTIIICGRGAVAEHIADTAALAGFHALRLDEGSGGDMAHTEAATGREVPAANMRHDTDDLFSCIGEVVIEASTDEEPAVRIARLNRLAEINHSDAVFLIHGLAEAEEGIPSAIVHPERVCMLDMGGGRAGTEWRVRGTRHSSQEALVTAAGIAALLGEAGLEAENRDGAPEGA